MQRNTQKVVVCISAALGTVALSYYLWKRIREERVLSPCKIALSIENRPVCIGIEGSFLDLHRNQQSAI